MKPVARLGGKLALPDSSQATRVRGVLLPTLTALVAALLVVGLAWRLQQESRAEILYSQLSSDANTFSMKVRDRLESYGLVLRGAGALFSTERTVTRKGWRNYVERLILYRDYPGIQGVGFSRVLLPEQVALHEQAMRAEGIADFRVWPPGRRERMSAVTYLEPASARNLRMLGFDMYSEPVRQEAMDRAREAGNLALSGKVILAQDPDGEVQTGVLLYLPLLGYGEQGPGPFLGWVYSPLRMVDLVVPVLRDFRGALRVRIYDGDQASAPALLFDSHPSEADDLVEDSMGDLSPVLRYTNPLLVQGRRWTLRFDGLPGYGGEHPMVSPGLAMLAALAVLMVAGTWMLFSARRQTRLLARLGESLRLREEQYSNLVNLSGDGICAVDQRMRFTFVNPRLAEWLGCSPEEFLGRLCLDFCMAGEEADRAAILARLASGEGQTYELRLCCPGRPERVVLASDHPLRDDAGALLGATMVMTDVTDRHVAAERNHFLATHDVLTGVPNRLSVQERLAQSIALARRYSRKVGVMFIDLDYFKVVNDTYGHGVGDRVLVECVGRIRQCLRSTDTLGRLGGDEFMVILPELDSALDGHAVATKIVDALACPIVIQEHQIQISASVGMAVFPEDSVDEEGLVNLADAAMYRAKCGGRGRVESGAGDDGAP